MSLAVLGKGRFYGWISLAGAALVFFFMYGVLTYSFGCSFLLYVRNLAGAGERCQGLILCSW